MCRLHFTVCSFSFVLVFWRLQHRSGERGPSRVESLGQGWGRARRRAQDTGQVCTRCAFGMRVWGKSQHCQDS